MPTHIQDASLESYLKDPVAANWARAFQEANNEKDDSKPSAKQQAIAPLGQGNFHDPAFEQDFTLLLDELAQGSQEVSVPNPLGKQVYLPHVADPLSTSVVATHSPVPDPLATSKPDVPSGQAPAAPDLALDKLG